MRRFLLPFATALVWLAAVLVAAMLLGPPIAEPMGPDRPLACGTSDACAPFPTTAQ